MCWVCEQAHFDHAVQVPDRVARWFRGQGEHTDEERLTQQAAGKMGSQITHRTGTTINAGTIAGALGGGQQGQLSGGQRGIGCPGGRGPQMWRVANLGDSMANRTVDGGEGVAACARATVAAAQDLSTLGDGRSARILAMLQVLQGYDYKGRALETVAKSASLQHRAALI